MTIKEVFDKAENGTLTLEQFSELAKDAKFTDLATGDYVSKRKYDDDLATRDGQIETLNNTIKDRDKDLDALKTKLDEAGTDASKIAGLSDELATLQSKYDADVKAYKTQLKEQAYDFATKEYASTKEFSSEAAKRDFLRQFKEASLKMDGDKIMGADDFFNKYAEENPTALATKPEPQPQPAPNPKPAFVNPTGGTEPPKPSLSELMRMKNENPDMQITF